jgi:hypothetical protein
MRKEHKVIEAYTIHELEYVLDEYLNKGWVLMHLYQSNNKVLWTLIFQMNHI